MATSPTNLELFTQAYEHFLTKDVAEHPDKWRYDVSAVPGVVKRMAAGFGTGNYNMSPNIQKAARSLKIKPTFKAIREFVNG